MSILPLKRQRIAAPPSRALSYLPATTLALDACLIIIAAGVAGAARSSVSIFDPTQANLANTLGVAGPSLVLAWVAALVAAGAYQQSIFAVGTDEYRRVINASLATAGVAGIGCYLIKFDLSRGFFLLFFCVGIPSLVLGRYSLRRALHSAHRRGSLMQRVLIAGTPAQVDEISVVLRRESWLGYQVVGALTPARHTEEETDAGIPVLGNAEDATTLACGVGRRHPFLRCGRPPVGRTDAPGGLGARGRTHPGRGRAQHRGYLQ